VFAVVAGVLALTVVGAAHRWHLRARRRRAVGLAARAAASDAALRGGKRPVDDAGDAGHHHPGHCSNLRFAVPTSCSTKCL